MNLIEITNVAREDIAESAEFISKENFGAAIRFLDAVEDSIKLIGRSPRIGRIHKSASRKHVRVWFVRGFSKYLVFYAINDHTISIVRVLHSARNYFNEFGFSAEDKVQFGTED